MLATVLVELKEKTPRTEEKSGTKRYWQIWVSVMQSKGRASEETLFKGTQCILNKRQCFPFAQEIDSVKNDQNLLSACRTSLCSKEASQLLSYREESQGFKGMRNCYISKYSLSNWYNHNGRNKMSSIMTSYIGKFTGNKQLICSIILQYKSFLRFKRFKSFI